MNKLFIKALIKKYDMEKEDAVELAKTIDKIFKGKKEVEDTSIDKYSRALFYELQKEKLLKIRREEKKSQGKVLRRYYWSYDMKIIKDEANKKLIEDKYKIYDKIPRSVWVHHVY